MSAKPYDIQWPLTPQRVEDINANFDAIWRAVSLVPSGGGSGGGGVSTHNLLSAVHLDTTPGVVVRGDLIIGAGATPTWSRLAKGTAAYVLTMGANEPAWSAIPAQTSLLLSATHTDTTPAAAVRGDVIVAQGVSPVWARLAKGTSGYFFKMGADEPAWAVHGLTYSDVGALAVGGTAVDSDKLDGQHGAYYAIAGAAPAAHQLDGALHTVSGLTAGHFLKALSATTFGFAVHGLVYGDVGAAPANHSILSATHGDSTAAAVVRGDLMVGIGASPLWTRLAKGTQYDTFQAGANEPGWVTNPRMPTLGLGMAAETGATAAVLAMTGAYYGVPIDDGNSGAAKTIDWITGNEHKLTLTAAPCTLTFSNPKTGGRYVLELVQDATGARTVVWPGTVIWNNGIPPSLTAVPGGIDLIAFYYDGTSYVGAGSGVGGGTVTSVGLSLPAQFTVSGSPVLASGTITAVWATQSPNLFFAGPSSGAAAIPTFRALVFADLPALASTNLTDTTNLARLDAANSFTLINPLTTIAESWIGPSSTTGIYFKGGKVGIGTATPSVFVDIYKSGESFNVGLHGGAATDCYFYVSENSGAAPYIAIGAYKGNISGATHLVLQPPAAGGYVGIGVIAPGYLLDVAGPVNVGSGYHGTDKLLFGLDPNHYLNYNATLDGVFISGATGVALAVSGTAKVTVTSTNVKMAMYGAGAATFDASGNITSVSDVRFKNRIAPLGYGLAEVLRLNPIRHGYNEVSGLERDHLYGGFLAHEVQQVIPLAVGQDARGYLTLADRPILGAVVNAVKELDARLRRLES